MFLKIEELKHVVIGRIKDAGYNAIQIDCNEWLTLYPQLTDYRIEVISPSGEIYFADTTMQGGVITWKLTARDTFQVGNGQYQVVAVGGNGERKTSSHPKITILEIANGTDADVPPNLSDAWTDTVVRNANAAIDAAEISKQNSEAAIDSANRAIALAEEISEATNRAEDAAERAEAAAERAESAGSSGGSAGGIVIETDPTVYDWAKQPQKPTYTADEVNAIGKDALPQAIEAALVQAKESGEFEGAPGPKGDPGADGGYYQPRVTDGVLSWTPSNGDMPSVPASDVRGPAGQDGQPGTPGKTAYQYAQDGGYTGTEAEFAVKLAEEVYSKAETDAAILSAIGGDNERFELIENIVLEEETAAIERNKEPNGKAYDFKEMIIYILNEAYEKQGGNLTWQMIFNGDGSGIIPWVVSQASNYQQHLAAYVKIHKGRCFYDTAASINGMSNTNVAMNQSANSKGLCEANNLRQFRLSVYQNTMRAGTTIKIYGVRNNA